MAGSKGPNLAELPGGEGKGVGKISVVWFEAFEDGDIYKCPPAPT
jgi:hypothetical protein